MGVTMNFCHFPREFCLYLDIENIYYTTLNIYIAYTDYDRSNSISFCYCDKKELFIVKRFIKQDKNQSTLRYSILSFIVKVFIKQNHSIHEDRTFLNLKIFYVMNLK